MLSITGVRYFSALCICLAVSTVCCAPPAFLTSPAGVTGSLEGVWLAQPGQSRRASTSGEPWYASNVDFRQIEPGGTLVLADLTGPGLITHIWTTINTDEPHYSRLLVLRIYWEGEEEPAVEVPLGDFFAAGHGLDLVVDSLPVRVGSRGRGRNCFWRMPFGRAAKITLTHEGRIPAQVYAHVDWVELPRLPRRALYFHARYRQEFPTQKGQRYLLADIAGRGQYVGTVLSVRSRAAGWFGEGDDFFFIDGDTVPTLEGTGTEDYFGGAFGLHQEHGAFFGVPRHQGGDGGLSTAYRWHLADPIIFRRSLRAELENTGFAGPGGEYRERQDDYSSVAFWYLDRPSAPWPPLPRGYERLYEDGFITTIMQSGLSRQRQTELVEEAFLYDPPVAAAPVRTDADTWRASTAQVVLRNWAEIPVAVNGTLVTQGAMRAEPAVVELQLAPGEERTIDIALTAPAGASVAGMAPVRGDWTLRYAGPGGRVLKAAYRRSLIVEAPFAIPRVTGPVVVDGDLGEWGELPFSAMQPGQLRMEPAAWDGPEDCSFRFSVMMCDDFLYLAVAAVDDTVLRVDEVPRWFQDGIEVRIDARPEPRRSTWNQPDGEFDEFLFLALRPGDTPADQDVYRSDRIPEGVQAVCVRTPGGHHTEVAIPHAVLDAYRGDDWNALRINIAVNDLDRPGGGFVQYWWRPDWRTPESYDGSGTFYRRFR